MVAIKPEPIEETLRDFYLPRLKQSLKHFHHFYVGKYMITNEEYTEDTWPKGRWKNFSFDEMKCQETGICALNAPFMDLLQDLRDTVGFPITISSGYRSLSHSLEAKKEKPGAHTFGMAADLVVSGAKAHQVLKTALMMGFTGIGLKQTGDHAKRFIHLDTLSPEDGLTDARPTVWTYG
jgi:zinc D-Ala-D-Ala carboxypeptidase